MAWSALSEKRATVSTKVAVKITTCFRNAAHFEGQLWQRESIVSLSERLGGWLCLPTTFFGIRDRNATAQSSPSSSSLPFEAYESTS